MLSAHVRQWTWGFRRNSYALLRLSPNQYIAYLGAVTLLLAFTISPDLELQTLAQFDDQVAAGNILYEATDAERFVDKGFEFEFRITKIFGQKSVLKAEDPNRFKAFEPFVNPDPGELVAPLGTKHKILLNKYAVYRPMLVIPTNQFAPQTDELDLSDFKAAWTLLQAFATPSVIIYNRGVNAGSSQGHKHLQMFPLPLHDLWPSRANSTTEMSTRLQNVPFKHFVLVLDSGVQPHQMLKIYEEMLGKVLTQLAVSGSSSRDYNVALTRSWIALIPRRTAGPGGPFGASAAGMLGLVNVPNEEERTWWGELGYTKYLAELGIDQ